MNIKCAIFFCLFFVFYKTDAQNYKDKYLKCNFITIYFDSNGTFIKKIQNWECKYSTIDSCWSKLNGIYTQNRDTLNVTFENGKTEKYLVVRKGTEFSNYACEIIFDEDCLINLMSNRRKGYIKFKNGYYLGDEQFVIR